jgi:predicted RNA-binding Zn-ribbon protein involved in translation (DUF1610 family)
MEKDVFECPRCGAQITFPDSPISGACPSCGTEISRRNGKKVGRETFAPYRTGGVDIGD